MNCLLQYQIQNYLNIFEWDNTGRDIKIISVKEVPLISIISVVRVLLLVLLNGLPNNSIILPYFGGFSEVFGGHFSYIFDVSTWD